MSNSYLFEARGETRPIRPYRGVSGVQKVFDGLLITVGDSEIFSSSTVVVDEGDFINEPVRALCWVDFEQKKVNEHAQWKANSQFIKDLRSSLQKTNVPTENLLVLFIASTSYLHLSETIWEGSVDEFMSALDNKIGLELVKRGAPRPRPLQTPHGGCDISVFLSLKDARAQKAGEAWRKGTWLANSEMKIRTGLGNFGFSFTPEKLTEEIREQFGLPTGTIRHIDCPSAIEAVDGPSHISIFIDEDILSHLNLDSTSDVSESFQYQIAIDVTTAVLYKGHKELSESDFESYSDIETSLCGQLIKGMATDASDNKFKPELADHLFNLLRQEPSQLVSHQEALLDPKEALLKTFTEGRQ
jgi:hypothetical protein